MSKFIRNFFGHLNTINRHKLEVMKNCFRVGLYKQAFLHDLSKYSFVEFFAGVRYFQGHRSPNNAQREAEGASFSWLHHKGRNKHHYEYWIDYPENKDMGLCGMKMPEKYVVEMFCDRVAACKIYNKEKYKDVDALNYYLKGRHHYVIHPETDELLHSLLKMLSEKGEKHTFDYIKKNII
jgi:hypothetical protein